MDDYNIRIELNSYFVMSSSTCHMSEKEVI